MTLVIRNQTVGWSRPIIRLESLHHVFIFIFIIFRSMDGNVISHNWFINICWGYLIFFLFNYLIMRWLPKLIFLIGLGLLNILVFDKVNDIFNLIFNINSAVWVLIEKFQKFMEFVLDRKTIISHIYIGSCCFSIDRLILVTL